MSKRYFDFYYPNKNNKFWKVLARIAKIDLTEFNKTEEWKVIAVAERKNILDCLKLGITDIGAKIYRQNDSSLDHSIFPIEFTDIFKILSEHPSINTIILTSSSKGNSVLSWFSTYCNMNRVGLEIDKKNKVFPKRTTININGREINVIIVYSTSGAAGKSEDFLTKQYGDILSL